MTLSNEVTSDIKSFLLANWDEFISDAKEYGELEITFATNDNGDTWNYQTGDNSFTGGCYSLPHWANNTIVNNCGLDPKSFALDIICDLTDCLPENR